MEAILEVTVRSTEIDINGHVNNAKYVEYLEWGRKLWYDLIEMPFDSFHAHGILTAIVNMNINYRKECHQNDQLQVITSPAKVGRTSYVFERKI
jgi:YbgC/YbaW family acyl-CoA thioester hydrolase